MIFIALFVIIAIVVVGLNLHNNSNLENIKEYVITSGCSNYTYSRGSYKALCEDKILEVKNSFTIDLEKNSVEILYSDIKKTDIKKQNIIINETTKLEFKLEDEAKEFYNDLNERLNK